MGIRDRLQAAAVVGPFDFLGLPSQWIFATSPARIPTVAGNRPFLERPRIPMNPQQLLALYRAMLTAREIDQREEEITRRGEAFFHLGGAGHEATAALALHLTRDDWLHCHYRDRALLLARGVASERFFDNLFGNSRSDSQGRRMTAFFSDPQLHILSMVTPVGNHCLQAVGIAEAVRDRSGSPLVMCGLGDGTTQQGEFYEACAQAQRRQLPVLFIVQENGWAISTRTAGQTCFTLTDHPTEFCGIPITTVDGTDVLAADQHFAQLVARIRSQRSPQLVRFQVARLCNHTNADDQRLYRPTDDLQFDQQHRDPIRRCYQQLLDCGVPADEIAACHAEVRRELQLAEQSSRQQLPPVASDSAKKVLPVELTHGSRERRGNGPAELTMREALLGVLDLQLERNSAVSLLGQDIADPKGDVFGVTRGLSTRHGDRVRNAPLSESTILGESIGRALAGERPVAMIQFADFLPLAYNQIVSELAMIHWRTAGAWQAPVIVMAPCGAYRPGLGPYHAQSPESTYAHIPGLDVVMPSTATDAAGLLNAAFQSGRPTMFFYPKALLNDRNTLTSADLDRQFIPIGPARKVQAGRDLTLVGWGNTVNVCVEAAAALESIGVTAEVLDLRSLSPWDQQTVIASAEKTAHLIVVHEENLTCGLGGEILATIAERARVPVAMRRVTRPDTHIPYHLASQLQLLPSVESVLIAAAELLDLELEWQQIAPPAPNQLVDIVAVGSGPADDQIQVVEWLVEVGQEIQPGTPLATVEATKSVFEIVSSYAGQVKQLLVPAGSSCPVGAPLVQLLPDAKTLPNLSPAAQPKRRPVLHRRPPSRLVVPRRDAEPRWFETGISMVCSVEGGRLVHNRDLPLGQQRSTEDIMRRTGIESRRWALPSESAIDLAAKACRDVLDQEQLILDDVDLLICSTTSPTSVTPSMACHVLNQLAGTRTETLVQAFDINAACSGYLYALQAAFDYLQSMPHGRVLVVTTEVLSPLLDTEDFDTAILFGDAASATVVYGEELLDKAVAKLRRPELSAKSDAGGVLSVPLLHDGFIRMQGRKVFTEAVRMMLNSLGRVCTHHGLDVSDLQMIVPHQANQRILDAIQQRVQPPVFSNIRHHGNTSSSSIPLCLAEVLPAAHAGDRLGLCAFGGGFTFGASLLEVS